MRAGDFIGYDQYISNSEWLIAIDPGHGGIIDGEYQTAPGKMYDHGDFIFHEGVFNRLVALELSKLLLKGEMSHYFTTTSNLDVSLQLRVNRANNFKRLYKDRKHLFLSVHGNAAPEGQEAAKGIEVFSSKGKTKSDRVATVFFKHLMGLGWKMRQDMSDGDPDKESGFYVLKRTFMPAVLVELGFYTNKEEALLMMEPKVHKEMASLLNSAIIEISKDGEDV